MIITEQTDITNLLAASRRVLVVAKDNPGHDEVASALAWALWLTEQKKDRVDVYVHTPSKNRFKFLPGFSDIREQVQSADEFIIKINVAKTKAKELSYDVKGETLEVKIKPEGGNFSPRDVSFAESSFGYDVIITLGATELAALGSVFENNRELFFNTPIINIDRQSRNIRYGHINAIYLMATSIAEITYRIIEKQITPDIATCLLTGLIAATNSFQTPQVNPDTLHLASELIVAGAAREEIVNHLYRTKNMDKLKIWGRVLSRLQQVATLIVYSDLTHDDIEGKDVDLPGLVEDLILASPEAHIVLFFFEAKKARRACMYTPGKIMIYPSCCSNSRQRATASRSW
ncbi:MAG: hypothetical protein HY422_01990 [Candidatus Komeilibacteria bacterium]|nr:hypothetical protein [Candidatus Komeilibacteria bacterium]